ncbi:YgjP-like metallopeptidase domain-containing protein [Paenibacillus mendelii]|uniref:YgjP-like metallopeptidase domain-containing protein n=1 Tax=Paenibacillus mendelii TaxID=206163 RepID=A0ABV6JFE5_9BACL|nr:YgjP-like metallopeptidase domain-containing protein [Paenibacillus mendelii]MCQ6563362.1 M48 family metallopeptidase [Paenibacillus mendelii]
MIYEELEKLRERIINASKEPTYGLHRKKQMLLFRSFKREDFGEKDINEDEISLLVNLTQQTFLVIERELKLTGFWGSIPARNKLKAELQKILLSPVFVMLPGLVKNRAHIISCIKSQRRITIPFCMRSDCIELKYTIERSAKRRKLTITVESDHSVVVHAPEGTSDEKIEQVVAPKRQWIYEKLAILRNIRICFMRRGKNSSVENLHFIWVANTASRSSKQGYRKLNLLNGNGISVRQNKRLSHE